MIADVAMKGSPTMASSPAVAQPASGTSVHAAAIASAVIHAAIRARWVTNSAAAAIAAIHANTVLGKACVITP